MEALKIQRYIRESLKELSLLLFLVAVMPRGCVGGVARQAEGMEWVSVEE